MKGDDENDFDRDTGNRLRLLRVTNRMSQAELGAAVGVTFQQIQKYENGSNGLSFRRAVQLARVLHTDVRDLTGERHRARNNTIDPQAVKMAQYFTEHLKRTPPSRRPSVLRAVNYVLTLICSGEVKRSAADKRRPA